MNSSRLWVLQGDEVKKPVWPAFNPSHHVAAAQASSTAAARQIQAEPDLDAARMEAAQLLQDAANQAEQAVESAREEGFEQGRNEGIEAGKAELEMLRQHAQLESQNARLQAENIRQTSESSAKLLRLEAEKEAQAIIADAREEARRITEEGRLEVQKRLEESQGALVDLAVAAATRIVQGHLALQPQAIVAMVAAGLRRLKDTHCTVRINPADLPLLEAQRSTLERELGAGVLQFSGDAGLNRGSYMVNSAQGQIDGTLEYQTERIEAALNAALGGKES